MPCTAVEVVPEEVRHLISQSGKPEFVGHVDQILSERTPVASYIAARSWPDSSGTLTKAAILCEEQLYIFTVYSPASVYFDIIEIGPELKWKIANAEGACLVSLGDQWSLQSPLKTDQFCWGDKHGAREFLKRIADLKDRYSQRHGMSEAFLSLERDFRSDFERDDLTKPWKSSKQASIAKEELLAALGDPTGSSYELYGILESAQGLDLSECELIPPLVESQHILPDWVAFKKLHRLLFCSLQRTGAEMVLSDEYLHHHNPFVAVFHADLVRRYRYHLIRKGKLDAKAYCDTLEEEKNLEWALGLRRPELVELLEKPGVGIEEQQILLQALFHPKYEIGRYDGITEIYRTRVDPEDNWGTLEAGLAGVLARLLHSEKRDKYSEPFWHDVGYYTWRLDSDSPYFARALVRALLRAGGDGGTVDPIARILRTIRSAHVRRELVDGLSRTALANAAARLAADCESREEWEPGELEHTLSALGGMGSVGEAELRKLVHCGRENLRERASEELQRLGIDERPMNVRVETVQVDSLAALLEDRMRWLSESGKTRILKTIGQQRPIRVYLTTMFNYDDPYYEQLLVLLRDGVYQNQAFLVDKVARYSNSRVTKFHNKAIFFLDWDYPVPYVAAWAEGKAAEESFFRSEEFREMYNGRRYVKTVRSASFAGLAHEYAEPMFWESEAQLEEFLQLCKPLVERAPVRPERTYEELADTQAPPDPAWMLAAPIADDRLEAWNAAMLEIPEYRALLARHFNEIQRKIRRVPGESLSEGTSFGLLLPIGRDKWAIKKVAGVTNGAFVTYASRFVVYDFDRNSFKAHSYDSLKGVETKKNLLSLALSGGEVLTCDFRLDFGWKTTLSILNLATGIGRGMSQKPLERYVESEMIKSNLQGLNDDMKRMLTYMSLVYGFFLEAIGGTDSTSGRL